ncbi:MAG TPA: hypothetical protein DEF41_15010 [Desulfovibrio sp.]|nr:hypothetical protein [Desulfovibrio sp.]
MRLYPVEPVIGDTDGFREDLDIFERKAFGERLEGLFANIEDPLVAVLDAPWGSGKTTFIKMWCGHMRNKGFPVIYFDAFKNDYEEDAFLAIAGEVVALAKEYEKHGVERRAFVEAAARCGNVLCAALKGGAKKLASKVIGDVGLEETCEAAMKDGTEQAIDDAHKHLVRKLESRNEEKSIVDDFRSALESIAESMNNASLQEHSVEGASKRPLVFIIDELDRCKPPFALEIIERIKHFFSVPNVHFLLVTNLKSLELSVKHVYGIGDFSTQYLQKFYNIIVSLDASKNIRYDPLDVWIENLYNMNSKVTNSEIQKECLFRIAKSCNVPFREIEKIYSIMIITSATVRDATYAESHVISYLCCMKVINKELYTKIKNGKASYDDALHPIGIDGFDASVAADKLVICLGSYLADQIIFDAHESFNMFRRHLSYNAKDEGWRKKQIMELCNIIDSLPAFTPTP